MTIPHSCTWPLTPQVLREVLRCFCHLLRGYLLPLKWGLVRGRRRPPSAASVHSPSSPFRPDLAHGALSRDATSASHRRPGSAHSSTAAGGSAAGGGPHSPLLRSSATARRPPGSDYLQEGSSTLGGGGGPGGLGTVGSEVDDAESEGMVVERPTLAQLGLRLFRAGYGGPLDEDDTAGGWVGGWTLHVYCLCTAVQLGVGMHCICWMCGDPACVV